MLETLALLREKEAPRKSTGQLKHTGDEIQDPSQFRRGSMPELTSVGDGYEKGTGESPNNSKAAAVDERKGTPPLKPVDNNRLGVLGPPKLTRIDASISYVEATDENPTVMIMPSENKEKDNIAKVVKRKVQVKIKIVKIKIVKIKIVKVVKDLILIGQEALEVQWIQMI
jgi:hypothetical protein